MCIPQCLTLYHYRSSRWVFHLCISPRCHVTYCCLPTQLFPISSSAPVHTLGAAAKKDKCVSGVYSQERSKVLEHNWSGNTVKKWVNLSILLTEKQLFKFSKELTSYNEACIKLSSFVAVQLHLIGELAPPAGAHTQFFFFFHILQHVEMENPRTVWLLSHQPSACTRDKRYLLHLIELCYL